MLKLLTLSLFSFLLTNSYLQAQDSTAAAAAADEGKLTISGYTDIYYNHAFNNPQSGSLMGPPTLNGNFPAGRAFDRTTDMFALGLIQTKFSYSNSKFDFVGDLVFGPNAELGNFGNQNFQAYNADSGFAQTPGKLNGVSLYTAPYFSNLYGSSASIKQAYGTWKVTSKLSLTVGQFGTHIGYEVIDAPVNYHYSLSNLFNNGPFYHIGLKANYLFSDKFGIMAGLVNNWDNLFDNNKQKSFVGQIFLQPVNKWNIYLNYIGGHGDDPYMSTFVGNTYDRHLFDVTTGFQITDKFYLGLNAAYGWYSSSEAETQEFFAGFTAPFGETSNKPDWGGVAGYVNYQFADFLGLGVRYEHFNDQYYVRYLGATNNSLTITAPITAAGGHLLLKPEFRLDTSPTPIYENELGEGVNSQSTLGMAAIFKF